MSIRTRVTALLVLLFLVAISGLVLNLWMEKLGNEKLRWVNHTHEVLLSSERLLSAMKDAETGQRGYLLTRDLSHLVPYYSGVDTSYENLDLLRDLTRDNPIQQALLLNVEGEVDRKLDELATTIKLARNNRLGTALEIVTGNSGKRFMDNLREQISEFNNTEMILLAQRKADLIQHRGRVDIMIMGAIAILLLLAVFTVFYFGRQLFQPLELLLKNARKVENGQRIEPGVTEVSDEMDHLLEAFYTMSEQVYQREQRLTRKAQADELTGLMNRTTLTDEMQACLDNLRGRTEKLGVLFIDIDNFKDINDWWGHKAGDTVLIECAQRIANTMRSSDSVFRIGGDEFVVLLKGLKHQNDIHDVTGKLLNAFDSPLEIDQHAMDISISIGAAIAPDHSVLQDELIKFADLAMYSAKKSVTGNSYQVYDPERLQQSEEAPQLVVHVADQS